MILFKKLAKEKLKSYLYCANQSFRKKLHKNETKTGNKISHFCKIFVIFLIFWPLELAKYHSDPLDFNLIFNVFLW